MDVLLKPQQELFLKYYTDPNSETFGNGVQSGLLAGFSESYATNIMSLMPAWLLENISDMKRLRKAEKNLSEVQNINIIDKDGNVDPQLVEKRTRVDMFIAERLNKNKYSLRQEITGKDGGAIKVEGVQISIRKNI